MSALGYIAGGLMQGLGSGMAEKAKMDWVERRELALQNARDRHATQLQERQFTLQDQNNANQEQRKLNADIKRAGVDAGITETRDKRLHGFSKEIRQIDFSNDLRLREAASRLGLQEDEVKRRRDLGEIRSIEEDGDGKFTIFYNDGTYKQTEATAPQRITGGSGSILEKLGTPQSGSQAPVPPEQKGGTLSAIPLVRTPEEARNLPKGTKFRTPDGRMFVS